MISLRELVIYSDHLLESNALPDYCPNGLQVEGREQVRRLVSGVSACRSLIEAAAGTGADLLLVHHGYFWKGEDARITGMKRARIKALLDAGISLLAYHLPLDVHPELGNNAQLALRLGFRVAGRFGRESGPAIGFHGVLDTPVAAAGLAERVRRVLGRMPLHVPGRADPIRSVAWCTGAAQGYIEAAADLDVDAYLTGEVSEATVHVARERGLHFFAAGHHATERYGVQALGIHLAEHFGLEHHFVDIDNPA
ncbi:MAG: Nif3-like dinuclear metal center hexameric protein [Chromatiales bacterium 21-64-14]|nr:MAG: Nif3-like dinuclear metal center hexameric protein [Chromatiales bacterium 21-64-14]HQU14918.1 Nif3-like dinuclear metal center hexameric protein [Gammaproteobacteria bacterium]